MVAGTGPTPSPAATSAITAWTSGLAHLKEDLGAVNVTLTPEDLRRIETEFSKIKIHGARSSPEDVLKDFDLLTRYRVRPTSLLRLNLELLPRTGRFLTAESLAAYV